MMKYGFVAASLCAVFGGAVALAQDGVKVDFARDVQPIFRQNCVSCHGPQKQSGGLRLDSKTSVFKPMARRVVPGNTANSILFHRLHGEFGPAMPPTGDLKAEQTEIIRRWIEQGAEWPDSLSNDEPLPPQDATAVAMVQMLHEGKLQAFINAATKNPKALNARGPEGSAPFMYAVEYTNSNVLTLLIKLGADVNAHNDAKATPLMWAANDLAKTQVLVAHGANVNAKSDDFHTPLMIASRKPGNVATVKLLLEHGAEPNPNRVPQAQSSPLLEAATAGDAATMAWLLDHGAVIKGDAQGIMTGAIYANCAKCFDMVAAKITDKDAYTGALQDTAVLGDPRSLRVMLEKGADPKAFDGGGRTALMYAAVSDMQPLENVKLLVQHGADVNATDKHKKGGDEGLTPLDMAKQHGTTPLVQFLLASGGTETGMKPVTLHPRTHNDVRSAVQDSLPLLQRADEGFSTGSGCISCHNNSLTAMAIGTARKQGLTVNESVAAKQVQVNVKALEISRDIMHQGFLLPSGDNFSEGVWAYLLMGLHAEGYKADLNTDAAAMYILARQQPDGSWYNPRADTRQPICLNYMGLTAEAIRALQLYAPKLESAKYQRAISKGTAWLAQAKSENNDDYSWRVAGLAWAGTNKPALAVAVKELVATQKSDGGWSDLPTMESDAYATGKSLTALHEAGMKATNPVYQRGVKWLLEHQEQDGSWFVRTRALAFQPDFDAGFPHGNNQFISSAGSGWAALALTYALPEQKKAVAHGR